MNAFKRVGRVVCIIGRLCLEQSLSSYINEHRRAFVFKSRKPVELGWGLRKIIGERTPDVLQVNPVAVWICDL